MTSSASSSPVRGGQHVDESALEFVGGAIGRAVKQRSHVVAPGRLPITELASDKPGAESPFGADITFPLPVEKLSFVAPATDAVDRAGH